MSAALREEVGEHLDLLRKMYGNKIEDWSIAGRLLIKCEAALLAKSAAYDALVARVEAAPVGECVLYDVCGMETPVIDLELTTPEAFPYISGMRVRLLVSDDRPSTVGDE